jgi:uncharacterized protein (DUF983 family)
MENTSKYNPTQNSFKSGMLGKCPRCQEGKIFSGLLKTAPECNVCGLDYSFTDTADGPAFFAMSIVMPFSMGMALWLELTYQVPIWVHLVTTIPFTLVSSLLLLRLIKGWLFSAEYIHEARDGSRTPKEYNKQSGDGES